MVAPTARCWQGTIADRAADAAAAVVVYLLPAREAPPDTILALYVP
jgi:hypothetical protein